MGTQGPPPTSDEKRYRELIAIHLGVGGLSKEQKQELAEVEARLDKADEKEIKRGHGSLHS